MKRFIIIGLQIFFFYVAQSQTLPLQIQESEVFKLTTARVQNDYILPDGKGGFVTISTKRSGFLANPLVFESYATYYNNDLEQISQKTFKLNKGSIKGSIKGAFVDNGKLKMINLETNYRKKYISFKRIIADLANDKVGEEEFFRIDKIYPKNEVNLYVNLNSLYYEKLKYYSDVNFFNPKIFVKFSSNNNYFAIVSQGFDKTKTNYRIDVFDKKFNKVFEKIMYNDNPPEVFYVNDILVDDYTGETYVVAKIFNFNPNLKKRLLNSDNFKNFSLYKFNKERSQTFEIKPDKVIEQLYLEKGEQLVVYGFFRNKFLNVNDIDGVFRMNIDVNVFEVSEGIYDNFSKKLVGTDLKKLHKKTKNHKMIVRKSYLLPDGSLLINSEDFYIPLMMKKRNREMDIREIVGNIFSIKVGSDGKVLWTKSIYKDQVVKPRLALHSFFTTLHHNYNYILFTDTRIEKPQKGEAFYLHNKDLQNLYGAKISMQGELKKGLVKENKRSKFRFIPIEGTMISEDEAIIPAKDHQFIKFYKIKF